MHHAPFISGGCSGPSHDGRTAERQGGLCQTLHRKRTQHDKVAHCEKTWRSLQSGWLTHFLVDWISLMSDVCNMLLLLWRGLMELLVVDLTWRRFSVFTLQCSSNSSISAFVTFSLQQALNAPRPVLTKKVQFTTTRSVSWLLGNLICLSGIVKYLESTCCLVHLNVHLMSGSAFS